MEDRAEMIKSLKSYFQTDVAYGKGGFFIKGKGFITIAKARKLTGIIAKKRNPTRKTGGYGDYAIIRKIVGKM